MKHTHQAREIAVLSQEAVEVEQALHADSVLDTVETNKEREELYIYLKRLYMSIGMKIVDVRRMKQAEKLHKAVVKQREGHLKWDGLQSE